jgi:hypothetical protein
MTIWQLLAFFVGAPVGAFLFTTLDDRPER